MGGRATARASPAVAALFDDGRQANLAGRPAEGERLLRRGLAALERRPDGLVPGFESVCGGEAGVVEARVRMMLSLSTSAVQRHGADRALEVAGAALELAQDPRLGEDEQVLLVTKCRLQLAMIHGRTGQVDAALGQLDQALAGYDRLGPRDRFDLLLSRGAVRTDGADPALAEADFAAAASIAQEADLPVQEFMARHNLAQAVSLRGDLPRALRLYRDIERLGAAASTAIALHGRSRTLLDAGLVDEARELLLRAAGEAERTGQWLVAGEVQADLAVAELAEGNLDQATRMAAAARRTLQGKAPGVRRRAELVLLDAGRRRGRRLAEVRRRGLALVDAFDRDGDHVAADLARLVVAETEVDRQRAGDAVQLLRASADLTHVGSLSTRLRARGVLAAAAREAQDHPTARRHLRSALTDLTQTVAGSSSLELRVATHHHARDLAAMDLAVAADTPRDRLLAIERWREAASRSPAVRPPADPELARRTAVLRHLRQQLREDPGRAGRLRPRLRELERSVAALSWSAPGAGGHRPVVTRDQLSGWLTTVHERDTSLVYLVDVAGTLVAEVCDRGRMRTVELGPTAPVLEQAQVLAADLETAARAHDGPMEELLQRSLTRSARALDELTLAPLRLAGRVLVVPTPGLAAVPWGLLPSRRGQPTPVAPSLGAWARDAATLAAPTVAALAGPELTRSQEEVDRVAQEWDSRRRPSRRVPAAAAHDLAAALADRDVVHVAAHGRHRDDSPLFSSLWLADGPYFLADLERESRRASHVVLSACDSGRARHRGGSAALGLAAGLLWLGVTSVVAAPCRIPDDVAADHTPRYHQLLAQGLPADEALSSAAAEAHPLAGAFVAWGAPWSAGPRGR
ncbi:CHAT domain-containing protein [Serinicoccus kebangsaanensis]|uniref:CHAT domain-containing protein n=1 Tax=Serinicoccus kebangsaanensis TaxID=2602069 RepID=UPI00124DED03|nr:CHAT domain-containing protein [Serinicoccus kebangsaanensis]